MERGVREEVGRGVREEGGEGGVEEKESLSRF